MEGRPVALPQLKTLLPRDRERANEVLERIFALDERDPAQAPEEAEKLLAWVARRSTPSTTRRCATTCGATAPAASGRIRAPNASGPG